MASSITLTISFTSLVGGKRAEGINILHQQGLLTESLLLTVAPYLGVEGLMGLDEFVKESFPIVEELEGSLPYSGDETALPELEGYIEYDATLEWWLGTVPSIMLIQAIKPEYYPIQVMEGGTYNSLQPEVLFDYLEVLEALKGLVDKYDQPRVEEEIEGVMERLESLTEADLGGGSVRWPWKPLDV